MNSNNSEVSKLEIYLKVEKQILYLKLTKKILIWISASGTHIIFMFNFYLNATF